VSVLSGVIVYFYKRLYQLLTVLGSVVLRTGRSNIGLPPELVAYIWSFLTLKDLVKFGQTSHANYRLVRGALRNTVHRLVAPFTSKGGVDRFMNMLRSERAVISGSMALFPLIFCNFSGTVSIGSFWVPHDMDIYEPKTTKGGSGVLKYLLEVEGYEEQNLEERSLQEQYDAWRGIRQMKNVVRDGFRVDIVTSSSSSAVSPIFYFHSTPVINWISPEGLFSAYPKLTCARRGLLNPMALDRTRFIPALPGASVRHSLDKYNIRGFDIRRNPSCWTDDSHPCTFAAKCPITTRNVVDGGCLFVPFTENFERKVFPYDSPYICFWYLGGPSCDGRRRVTDPYVSLRTDADDERFFA
jgi:hypothetical protein